MPIQQKNEGSDIIEVGRMKVLLIVLLSLTLGGCVAPHKFSYTPAELRAELGKRVPARLITVPFEVEPQHVDLVRRATWSRLPPADQAKDLIRALFNKDFFGLEYVPVVTATALETLESRRGNCLSLASVYVGLARALGLKANFLDASNLVEHEHSDQEILVKTGHVTAVVETLNGEVVLDVGFVLKYYRVYRVIDDIEATAHFYNNRGYELIYQAQQKGEPIDWPEAAENFRLATRVMPGFVRGWNNLGVAYTRQGREKEAAESYRRALALDPDFDSARINLEILMTRQKKNLTR
jgi:tetratricopeptide (TPR) repeat protein